MRIASHIRESFDPSDGNAEPHPKHGNFEDPWIFTTGTWGSQVRSLYVVVGVGKNLMEQALATFNVVDGSLDNGFRIEVVKVLKARQGSIGANV